MKVTSKQKTSWKAKLACALAVALFANVAATPVYAGHHGKDYNNGAIIDRSYDPFAEEDPAVAAADPREGVAPGHVYIPRGTKLRVELVDEVNSKKTKKNQLVEIRLVENLIVNGVIVIPEGTIGTGYVWEARKAGGVGRKGVLRIAGKDIKTVNNIVVPLKQGLQGKGRTDGGAAAVTALVTVVGGLFMKGSNVTYPAGTDFYVEVRENVDLQTTPEGLADAMDPSIPHGNEITVSVG